METRDTRSLETIYGRRYGFRKGTSPRSWKLGVFDKQFNILWEFDWLPSGVVDLKGFAVPQGRGFDWSLNDVLKLTMDFSQMPKLGSSGVNLTLS